MTLLAHSGLPRTWWPVASRFYCHMCNGQSIDRKSAWSRRRGREFQGVVYPFDARIDFLPPTPSSKEHSKFAPRVVMEIVGYFLAMGAHGASR